MERIKSENTVLFGLIGYPLGHSFSETFFNQKFENEKIDAKYINFEIDDIDRLSDILATYPNLAGFNVTRPYKEKVMAFLDDIDKDSEKIGAVNVVKVFRQPDGSVSLKGYNSDCPGFADSIGPMINPELHRRALVLGSGGASKAVSCALQTLGVEVTVVSRSQKEGVITYQSLTPEVIADHKIIVNTTPLGMYPHVDECPEIPYEGITPEHICYDLIYNPDTTLFLKKAAERGANIKNGLEMLLLQAFISWNIWNR